MSFKDFLAKNREVAQLAYGIILIILIPILISYNTVFIIDKYNKSLDVTLQRQALTIGRSIYSLVKEDLGQPEKLQEDVDKLMKDNNAFIDLTILNPEGDNFKIIASSNSENINKAVDFDYYRLAWMQPNNNALVTNSLRLAKTDTGDYFVQKDDKQGRYWLISMPMSDKDGNKKSLLSMRISSKIVDDLTDYNRNTSIYILIGTVVIVILFLLIAVRMWDYVVLYKKVKEVDQMKDEFISMASHELRTPVTGIRGYVSMVLDGSLGEVNTEVKNSLKIVNNASERLATLVDDLLNVSRIEQGRMKIEIKPTDIEPIIKTIMEELNIQAQQKNLTLKYTSNVGKMGIINIDTDRFKQVLINLIGNAIKYTEKGGVEVIIDEKNNGKNLEIKIKDTGIGMSAKDRERLFEKFYRVKNNKTEKITGTGLGLWITKQIIVLMKGAIAVDSIENVGTQVTLLFPIVKK